MKIGIYNDTCRAGKNRVIRGGSGFLLLYVGLLPPCFALEPEPRKWQHLPVGTNIAGIGYAHTEADILLDPTFRLEDVGMSLDTLAGKYVHTFELSGKSARIELTQAYQDGIWTGVIDGDQKSVSRSGLADTVARFAINLNDAPPLSGKDYAAYRAQVDKETLVGAGLAVRLPTGEYFEDQLVNIGDNRFTFRPQIGVTHNAGKWTTEVTGEAALFTDNDQYFKGKTLQQDPLYVLHSHLSYTIRPGFWVGGGLSYEAGGEKTVNGVDKNDSKENVAWGLNLAYPLSRHASVNAKYVGSQTQKDTGLDSDTFSVGTSLSW
jgi:hypothetical protein